MFSCSRNCLSYNIRKKAVVDADSPARAPLLFLYPKWYRDQIKGLHHAVNVAGRDGGTSEDPETTVERKSTSIRQTPDFQPAPDHSTTILGDSESATYCQCSNQFSQHSRSFPSQRRYVQRSACRSLTELINERLRRKARHEKSLKTRPTQTATSALDLSKSLKPLHRSFRQSFGNLPDAIRPNKTPEAHARLLERLARKGRYQRDRRNWEIPLKTLANETQHPRPLVGEVLELDKRTVYELTGTFNENVWTHHVRSGCEVHVLPPPESELRIRHVLLRGEKRARELTKEYLLHFQETLTQPEPTIEADGEDGPRIRFYRYRTEHRLSVNGYVRIGDLPTPKIWTIRSFTDYVGSLVHMRVPRTVSREIYQPDTTHNKNVASMLERLFRDPRMAPFISTRALEYALSFASRHTAHSSTLFTLYNIGKASGLTLPADIFNIVIKCALALKPPSDFIGILQDMKAMNVPPNGETWAKLLAIVTDQDARRHILAYMQVGNLLESRNTVNAIAAELVRTDLLDFAKREGGFEEFLEAMDDLLGKSWVSTRAVNSMLKACVERGQWAAATAVTRMSVERGVRLTSRSLNYLIKLTQKRGYLRNSLDILQSKFAQTVGWDDTFVVSTIFMTAWKSGFLNVCRVLWHYAATRGIISYKMQETVMSSLISNLGLQGSLARRSMSSLAGKMTLISDIGVVGDGAVFPLLSSRFGFSDPFAWLLKWTPDDGTRDEQISLAYVIMHQNLSAWKKYKPMEQAYFFNLLQDSFDIDYAWRIRNIAITSRPSILLEQAIKINLVASSSLNSSHPSKAAYASPPLLQAPLRNRVKQVSFGADVERSTTQETVIANLQISAYSHQFKNLLCRAWNWRSIPTDLKGLSSIFPSYELVPQVVQRRYMTTEGSSISVQAAHAGSRDLPLSIRRYYVSQQDDCPWKMNTGPRRTAMQPAWREPRLPWEEILPLHRASNPTKTETRHPGSNLPLRSEGIVTSLPNRVPLVRSTDPSTVVEPTIRIIESPWSTVESPMSLTPIERLRLRSAFITWETSDIHIKIVKKLDWWKIRRAISVRGQVTRNWYRVGWLCLLLSHIKESYWCRQRLGFQLSNREHIKNNRPNYYVLTKDLDKFEDLAALKYACARLIERSRGMYHYLLLDPDLHKESPLLKRRIAVQAENMRRLESLIEPFYDEWVATGKMGDAPHFRPWPHFKNFRRSLSFREFLDRKGILEWKRLRPMKRPIDLSRVEQAEVEFRVASTEAEKPSDDNMI